MKYGRYQVIKELGKGSMGIVYQAHDPNLDVTVALKILRPEKVVSHSFVQRFLREAKALGRLDRANIVRIYNVDEDKGTVYIAMEYIDGESLNDVMRQNKFSVEEIISLGATVAQTLAYAHSQGIVHRDIKPGNILIRPDGWLKITDFGIAHIESSYSSEQTHDGEILGTPSYMSPEQVMSQNLDGRSDLYSLGIILYELCTGSKPFVGDNLSAILHAITQDEAPDIRQLNPAIPKDLSEIIMKCLSKKPDDRFDSGTALAQALKDCSREEETLALRTPFGLKSQRTLIISITSAIIIFLTGTLLYYYLTNTSSPKSSLIVDSIPAGAQVYVNGEFSGETPVTMELVVGKHEVRLTALHYYEWEAQVQLEEEEQTPLSVRLIPHENKQ